MIQPNHSSITLPSPAKLNLFLHINRRIENGYHELQTIFQLLDYGDQLEIQVTPHSPEITISPSIPHLAEQDNLIYKAGKALQEYTKTKHGAAIKLSKRLPMGGGLGGGSSNAATALVGLNHLWQTHIPAPELALIGRSFGADIPVFIHGHSAWAEGIGDLITPMTLPERFYLVIKPNCHVSTREIFSHKNLTRNTAKIKVAAFPEKGGVNDFQPLVESLYPEVKNALAWLNQYAEAKLTGTGACVFAAFDTQESAQQVLTQLFREALKDESLSDASGFVAKGVNKSPLHAQLPTHVF